MPLDLFIPADTVVELINTVQNEVPYLSLRTNTFFLIDEQELPKNRLEYLSKDKYGRFHIKHQEDDVHKILSLCLKATKMFIVEPLSMYNIVIRGTDTLIDVIQHNDVHMVDGQISQLRIERNNMNYLITKIELLDTIEKPFIIASMIMSELRNANGWVITDSAVQKKIEKLISLI